MIALKRMDVRRGTKRSSPCSGSKHSTCKKLDTFSYFDKFKLNSKFPIPSVKSTLPSTSDSNEEKMTAGNQARNEDVPFVSPIYTIYFAQMTSK